jgi:hypothetical protein
MTASIKDTATIAALSVKLDGAIAQLADMKAQFNAFQAGFVRSDLYNIKHEELVKQVALNSNEIAHLQKNKWVMPTISLIVGGVMVFLINFALSH